MDDVFPEKRHRRSQLDLNVVPILDMLVCIIFFLLLATSFVGYSKLSIPPSGTVTITDPLLPPPLNPKLLIVKLSNESYKATLTWEGAQPGHFSEKIIVKNLSESLKDVEKQISTMITRLSNEQNIQKTLQIGLGENVPYQILVTAMDAAREKMPDQVLISYLEAQVLSDKMVSN